MKRPILLILLLIATITYAKNPIKSYKDLQSGKKEEAFNSFQEICKKDSNSIIANYALALLYSDANFSRYDLEQAYKFSHKPTKYISSNNWNEQVVKSELKHIKKLSLEPNLVLQLNDMILDKLYQNLILKNEKNSWENSVTNLKTFVRKYSEYKGIKDAQDKLEKYEFNLANRQNTIEAFQNFINQYPKSNLVGIASINICELEFHAVKEKNRIKDYEKFISKYPNSSQATLAKQNIVEIAFNDASKINTVEAYNEFIKNYPNSSKVIDANGQIAYIQAKEENTITAYNDFIIKYPSSTRVIDAKEKINEFNFKTFMKDYSVQSFQDYFKEFPDAYQCKYVQDKLTDLGLVIDIDGNIYHTFKVGNQTWMFENLQTTKYNDGTNIESVENLSTEKYQNGMLIEAKNNLGGKTIGRYYKFDVTGKNEIYKSTITKGILYNYAAMNSNKLCPVGWHVPTDKDWLIFIKTFCELDKYESEVELTSMGKERFRNEFNGNYVCSASSGGGLFFTFPNHAWSTDGGHLWSSSGKYLYYFDGDNTLGQGFFLGLGEKKDEGNYYSYCVRCIKDDDHDNARKYKK